MRYLYEVWEGKNIYFNPDYGQFETERGYMSYVQSQARTMALVEERKLLFSSRKSQ